MGKSFSRSSFCSFLLFVVTIIIPFTAIFAAGKSDEKHLAAAKRFLNSDIVQEKNCFICHTIGTSGGTVGPILNQVSNRRSPEWLRKWLKDPNKVKPGTKMPNFEFSDDEIETIVGYFKYMKRDIDSEQILNDHSDIQKAGGELFKAYDCLACHRLGKTGRFTGPNLTWIGVRKTSDWVSVWLKDPPAYKPDTFMPNFKLSDGEIDALTHYLASLKGSENEAARDWESITAFFLDARPRERGRLVADRLACWSCHGPALDEGVENPNAQPDGFVPAINTSYFDFEEEDLIAIILEGSTPLKIEPNGETPPFSCPPWEDALNELEIADLLSYLDSIVPESSKWGFE
ncbi:MAG: c-type cytochrome [Candidatus Marinimicrobia bacterium]|nr:c-type cytochrome [Candidatus Neomarinimicrobiota bacterium]